MDVVAVCDIILIRHTFHDAEPLFAGILRTSLSCSPKASHKYLNPIEVSAFHLSQAVFIYFITSIANGVAVGSVCDFAGHVFYALAEAGIAERKLIGYPLYSSGSITSPFFSREIAP